MRMFITSKNKYLSNDTKIFGTCSIPLRQVSRILKAIHFNNSILFLAVMVYQSLISPPEKRSIKIVTVAIIMHNFTLAPKIEHLNSNLFIHQFRGRSHRPDIKKAMWELKWFLSSFQWMKMRIIIWGKQIQPIDRQIRRGRCGEIDSLVGSVSVLPYWYTVGVVHGVLKVFQSFVNRWTSMHVFTLPPLPVSFLVSFLSHDWVWIEIGLSEHAKALTGIRQLCFL